eukprot:NODE_1_length_95616_cov_0.657642.p37 type:complete len:306 gc:universal NODE_1_length_95616_cov_0.657642:7786-6869(-)
MQNPFKYLSALAEASEFIKLNENCGQGYTFQYAVAIELCYPHSGLHKRLLRQLNIKDAFPLKYKRITFFRDVSEIEPLLEHDPYQILMTQDNSRRDENNNFVNNNLVDIAFKYSNGSILRIECKNRDPKYKSARQSEIIKYFAAIQDWYGDDIRGHGAVLSAKRLDLRGLNLEPFNQNARSKMIVVNSVGSIRRKLLPFDVIANISKWNFTKKGTNPIYKAFMAKHSFRTLRRKQVLDLCRCKDIRNKIFNGLYKHCESIGLYENNTLVLQISTGDYQNMLCYEKITTISITYGFLNAKIVLRRR